MERDGTVKTVVNRVKGVVETTQPVITWLVSVMMAVKPVGQDLFVKKVIFFYWNVKLNKTDEQNQKKRQTDFHMTLIFDLISTSFATIDGSIRSDPLFLRLMVAKIKLFQRNLRYIDEIINFYIACGSKIFK